MPETIEWQTNETTTSETGGDTLTAVYGILDLDAVIVESYDEAAEITAHPVEEGANISDHSKPGLKMRSLDIAISNTPIEPTLDHGASIENIDLSLPSKTRITRGARGKVFSPQSAGAPSSYGLVVDQSERSETEEEQLQQGVRVLKFTEDEFDRCREVYETIADLKDNGIPIDIVGARFGDMEGYLIASYSIPVENDNGIRFSLDVQELRTARTQTVEAPSPRVERGRNRRQRGRQPGTDEETDGRTRPRSLGREALESESNPWGIDNLLSAGG